MNEKETRLKEMLKVMSVGTGAMWAAWILGSYVVWSVVALEVTILSRVSKISSLHRAVVMGRLVLGRSWVCSTWPIFG